MFQEIVNAITNGQAHYLAPVVLGLALTFTAIYMLKGRIWAFLYVALIPFLNWSFGIIPQIGIIAPNELFEKGVALHPMTVVTGLVFVIRDFVQREMGPKVLAAMAMAIGWSFFYALPVIALVSGIAFAVSETVDWLIFTFTRYRLSTRILLSSALATPIDTTVFLYGADIAMQRAQGAEPGNMLHLANWIVFVLGKMVGALIISHIIRQREDAGLIDPEGTVESPGIGS